jgi:transposase-like protein
MPGAGVVHPISLRKGELRLIVIPRRDTLRQRDQQAPQGAEETVRDIRRYFSAEEKIRIVLEACAARTASLSRGHPRESPAASSRMGRISPEILRLREA